MRIELDPHKRPHMHADCRYKPLEAYDYLLGVKDIFLAVRDKAHSLNFHLPYEIQFTSYLDEAKGRKYIRFINTVGRLMGVRVVWENTNILDTSDWSIVENPSHIPTDLDLCFDLGHFILGCKSRDEALQKIDEFFHTHGESIKHMHLHVNDLVHDRHWYEESKVKEFLGEKRFASMTEGRSYIFEVSS